MNASHLAITAALVCAACSADRPAPPRTATTNWHADTALHVVQSEAPAWTDAERWRITDHPIVEIRAPDEDDATDTPLDPGSIYRTPGGEYVIADGLTAGWHAIMVYDSAGKFLRKFGQRGQGPGEFGQVWWAEPYRGDSIAVFDMGRDRVALFSATGSYGRVLDIPKLMEAPPRGTYGFAPYALGVFADGSVAASPYGVLDLGDGKPGDKWYRNLLLRIAMDGTRFDTIGSLRNAQQHWDGTRQNALYYGGVEPSTVAGAYLYVVRADSFHVVIYDTVGRKRAVFERPFDAPRVTEGERKQFVDFMLALSKGDNVHGFDEARFAASAKQWRYAERKPSAQQVLLDDEGNVWVQHYLFPSDTPPRSLASTWTIFGADGRWLGDLELPAGFVVKRVDSQRIMGFAVDELDAKHVQVYGLIKPGR